MVYELRVYHIVPGRMPAILKRFDTITCRLFEKHGIKQVGFWTTAIGESTSDLTYMLQWESMTDRDKKWAAFATDPEWIEGRAKSEADGAIVGSITNSILMPTSFSAMR